MLNTRASINKAFAGAKLGIALLLDDYQELPPGTGTYPAVAVRILTADAPPDTHIGQQTPLTPTGAERYLLVVEAEIRTSSQTWNQALHYSGLLRTAIDRKRLPRMTWLLNAETVNPAPVQAGFLRFNRGSEVPLQDPQQSSYKSVFLTWECQVEVPTA